MEIIPKIIMNGIGFVDPDYEYNVIAPTLEQSYLLLALVHTRPMQALERINTTENIANSYTEKPLHWRWRLKVLPGFDSDLPVN